MEIYLTKMILNPQSRKVWNDLGNLQELHRTVSSAFPKIENDEALPHHERKTPRNEFNLLHRLDFNRKSGTAVLLIQSTVEPDWSFLDSSYANEFQCKTVHDKYERIENGMNLLFRLQANPTKRVGKSDTIAEAKFKESKIRRRVELRTDEEKLGWLQRKGAESGFQLAKVRIKDRVDNVSSIEQGKISFSKKRKSPLLTFSAVVFEGILQVIDANKFREALVRGIGTGKAYGFGLLSVAPIKEN